MEKETLSTLVGMESIPMDMVTMASTLEAIVPVVLETLLELEATRLILVRNSKCTVCAIIYIHRFSSFSDSGYYYPYRPYRPHYSDATAEAQGRYHQELPQTCSEKCVGIFLCPMSFP